MRQRRYGQRSGMEDLKDRVVNRLKCCRRPNLHQMRQCRWHHLQNENMLYGCTGGCGGRKGLRSVVTRPGLIPSSAFYPICDLGQQLLNVLWVSGYSFIKWEWDWLPCLHLQVNGEVQIKNVRRPLCISSKCCIKGLAYARYLTECLNECRGVTIITYLCFTRDQMKKLWWIRAGPVRFSIFTMRKKNWKVRIAVLCNG